MSDDTAKTQEYKRLFLQHEELTDKIIRLKRQLEKFGYDREIDTAIKAHDKERFDVHRELEKAGREIDKSEHEIRQELLAHRFSMGRETKIPGLIVVPVPFSDDSPFDPRRSEYNLFNAGVMEFDLLSPPSDYFALNQFDGLNGYIIIYDMKNFAGGEEVIEWVQVQDGASEIKDERIRKLEEHLKKQYPDGDFEIMEWSNGGGGYHVFVENAYKGLYVDEKYLEHAMEAVREHREEFWLTDKEYQELGKQVVREVKKIIPFWELPNYVDEELKPYAQDLYREWKLGLKSDKEEEELRIKYEQHYLNEDEIKKISTGFTRNERIVEDAQGNILETQKKITAYGTDLEISETEIRNKLMDLERHQEESWAEGWDLQDELEKGEHYGRRKKV